MRLVATEPTCTTAGLPGLWNRQMKAGLPFWGAPRRRPRSRGGGGHMHDATDVQLAISCDAGGCFLGRHNSAWQQVLQYGVLLWMDEDQEGRRPETIAAVHEL